MSTGSGSEANPRDGDRVTMEVVIVDDTVVVKRTDVRGCHAAHRAADELVKMARSRTPEDAARIAPRELIDRLRLEPDEERCALTAIAALRAALVDAHVRSLA